MADLTTLAAVKAYAGIAGTEMDTLLGQLITRTSASVENFLQRTLLTTTHTETRDGSGGRALLLAEYPVTAVASVSVNGQPIPQALAWGQAGWLLTGDRTLVLTGQRFEPGRGNVVVSYTAGYATAPADIEQACIETVMLAMKRREHIDVSSKSLAGETISYITTELTPSARQVLNSYRRVAPL